MCPFFIRRLSVISSPIESKFGCLLHIHNFCVLRCEKPAHPRALPMLLRPELHESPNGPDHIHIVIFVLCLHGPNYFVATFALGWPADPIIANKLATIPWSRRVLVRLDHIASFIINANHSIMWAAAVHCVADCMKGRPYPALYQSLIY